MRQIFSQRQPGECVTSRSRRTLCPNGTKLRNPPQRGSAAPAQGNALGNNPLQDRALKGRLKSPHQNGVLISHHSTRCPKPQQRQPAARAIPSLLCAAIFAFLLLGCRTEPPLDHSLTSPIALWDQAKAANADPIYLNPEAATALASASPAPTPPNPADSRAAATDPKAWRQLDRRLRFETVLLAGAPATTAPLARHLAASPDFRLVAVDNWGFLFERGRPTPFEPRSPDTFTLPTADQRALALARYAINLDTIGKSDASRTALAEAISLAPKLPDVHVAEAYIDLQRERFSDAVVAADAALKRMPESPAALEIRAQALAAQGQAEAAWQTAEALLSAAPPDNMQVLFLHARLARDARAYSREQASLERLIELASGHKLPTTPYRVFLAQSYARQGLPRPAIEQLTRAAEDPDLTGQQRADIDDALATIRAKSGL